MSPSRDFLARIYWYKTDRLWTKEESEAATNDYFVNL
jgi:hypothetical protein